MSFGDDVAGFARKAGRSLEQTARGVELRLFRAVIMDTPVLDGRLRGDWQTTTDTPASGENGRADKEGGATLAEMESIVAAIQGGSYTLLTNNMPYAYRIEFEGYSKTKAPEGMVRKNEARFRQLLQEEAQKNRV